MKRREALVAICAIPALITTTPYENPNTILYEIYRTTGQRVRMKELVPGDEFIMLDQKWKAAKHPVLNDNGIWGIEAQKL